MRDGHHPRKYRCTCVCLFVPPSLPNVCAFPQSATREQAEVTSGEEIDGRSAPRRLGRLLNPSFSRPHTNSIYVYEYLQFSRFQRNLSKFPALCRREAFFYSIHSIFVTFCCIATCCIGILPRGVFVCVPVFSVWK